MANARFIKTELGIEPSGTRATGRYRPMGHVSESRGIRYTEAAMKGGGKQSASSQEKGESKGSGKGAWGKSEQQGQHWQRGGQPYASNWRAEHWHGGWDWSADWDSHWWGQQGWRWA